MLTDREQEDMTGFLFFLSNTNILHNLITSQLDDDVLKVSIISKYFYFLDLRV